MSLVFDIDQWNQYQWDEFLINYPGIGPAICIASHNINNQFPHFAEEIFGRLYGEPEALETPRPECQWAQDAHDWLDQQIPFQNLIDTVTGDPFLAGIGAAAMIELICREYNPLEHGSNKPEPVEAPDLAGIQAKRDQIHEIAALPPAHQEARQDQVQQLQKEGKAGVKAAISYAQDLKPGMANTLTYAATEAATQVGALEDLTQAYGWGSDWGCVGMGGDLKAKLAIAQKLAQSEKLKRIARLAGNLQATAIRKQRSKVKAGCTDVVGVTTGRDLPRLLPTETVKMAVPALHGQFLQGYTERSLQQFELESHEPQKRGPIVVGIDISGSMKGPKEEWSKAVALTLLRIAIKQHRHCRILLFTARVERIIDLPPGKTHDQTLLDTMSWGCGGGTSWQAPVDEAIACIETTSGLRQADIILISDDECATQKSWREQLAEKQRSLGFCLYGIAVGKGGNSMTELCNEVLPITNLDAANIDTILEI